MFLNSTKKTIVIAGAGFGGLRTALDLDRAFQKKPKLAKDYNLYLIDQNNHHLYTPGLYEVATTIYDDARVQKLKKVITLSLESIFKNGPLKFLQAKILNFDPLKNIITLNDHTLLRFDYLVMALGSETNFYNIPGLKEKALTLNNLNTAIRLRNETEKKFSQAIAEKKQINIVFGGGGVTGVELAGEIYGYIKKLNKKYESKVKSNIIIIEGQNNILPGFDPKIMDWAQKRLEKLGTKIETGEMINEVKENSVFTKSGKEFQFDILVWSGGIKPNHLIDNLPFKKDPKGKVTVKQNFCPMFEAATPETANECSNVLVIGDNCSYMMNGQAMPQTAQMAINEGQYAAQVILAKIKKCPLTKYIFSRNYYVLPIGGKFALADLGSMRLKGVFAWLLKEFIFLEYMLSILTIPQALMRWLKAVNLFAKND